MRKWLRTTSVLVLVQLLLVAWAGVATSGNDGEERPQASLILNVGFQGDLLARNYLRNRDRLTSGILDPVYDPVGKLEPKTEEPIPYLLKGVDADESGTFDLDEYGIYVKDVGTDILEVTAHYDFNGVLSHDGVQMTMDDLLFSYHIAALSPMRGDIDVVKDKNGLPGSNYTTSRWLNVWPVTDVWDPNIPVGPDASLTFALHFSQQAPYTGFVKHTLNAITLMPRHIWEGTGKVCLDATNGICNNWKQNIHTDFGHAYDEVTHNGIPAVDPSSFEYWKAESWLPGDDEVIGTGPFEFDVWVPGVSTRIVRFDDYKVDVLGCVRTGAPPACNGDFFSYLHKPYVDEIFFKIYKTVVACAFAMQADEIQYIGSSLTPELLPPLQSDPTIGVELTANKGFGHLGYNMRMSPFGYVSNDPLQGDHGFWLRRAVAHVVDRNLIRTVLFQNYSVVGDQPISYANARWYNGSVQKYIFDLNVARGILDSHYTIGGFSLGWGPSGYRNLPTIGDRQIDLLCVQADYDPAQAQSCNLIAFNMRNVGINAMAKLMAHGEIVDRLENRNFEIWFVEDDVFTEPPEYYHSFFHSRNAPVGYNYAGFQNASFDDTITQARAELDMTSRISLIKYASGILAENLPYDAVFFRTNIEAYRHDRYINWTGGPASSIYHKSYWSWIGIHPPGISVQLSFPSGTTVNENDTLVFDLLVTNATGDPADNASVTISCAPAGPVIFPNSGLTVNGSIGQINFTTAEVDYDTFFKITARANMSGDVGIDEAWILVVNIDTQPRPPALTGAILSGAAKEDVTMEWILSQDDGQGNASVVRYDIYRSVVYDPRGWNYTLHDSVPNGTSSFVDAGAGEGDSWAYFYRVCALDAGGNSTCSSRQAGKFTRPLAVGPNLVSIPLIQSNESAESVLQTVKHDRSWFYDSDEREWTSLMRSKSYATFDEVSHTIGLWVSVNGPSNLTVAGIVPARTTILLHKGWNLISFPSLNTTYSVGDLKVGTGATRVEGFDPSAPPCYLRVLTNGELLQAGQGYWVSVDLDAVWVIGSD